MEKKMEEPTPESTWPIIVRVISVEHDIVMLKSQINLTVPTKENDLQLTNMRLILDRMETEIGQTKDQLGSLVAKQIEQASEAQKNVAEQRESQAALLIKILWGIVSLIIGILTSVVVGYITHFFH